MNLYTIKTYSQRQKDRLVKKLLDVGFELYKSYSGYPKTVTANRREHPYSDCPYIVFYSNGYVANASELDDYYNEKFTNLDAKADFNVFIGILKDFKKKNKKK